MSIVNRTLSTIPDPVYTSAGQTVVTLGYFCNIDSLAQNINIFLVPNGSSPDLTNIIYSNVQITSSDTMVMDMEKIILDNGDAMYANATANSAIVATIGYIGL